MTSKNHTTKDHDVHADGTNGAPPIEMIEVERLQPHPDQQDLVGDMRDGEFEGLVADIEANGIQNPLTIMGDRTMVVCGHQRWRVAKKIGLEKVPCIVRHDFVDPNHPAVIQLLVSDNLVRRQLSPLGKARHVKALAEAEYQLRTEPAFRYDERERQAVRDAIGKILNCSGRNIDRYLAALRTPDAVQRAFDAGLVTLTLAARVATASPEAQEELAKSTEKLLKKAKRDAKAAKEIRNSLRGLVDHALQSVRPRRSRRPRPTAEARVLRELSRGVEKNLPIIQSNKDKLIKFLREEKGVPSTGYVYITDNYGADVRKLRRISDELREVMQEIGDAVLVR